MTTTSDPISSVARRRLLAAMPVTERHFTLAGVRTSVLEAGEGPPLVLLHGAGEFGAVWMRVVGELARGHQVVVPDLPGHGASEYDGELDVTEWVASLIDQCCPSPPIVVGHHLGGALALHLAIAGLRQLRGLVLVDTLGLALSDPAPDFAAALHDFTARATADSRDRLFQHCFVDLARIRDEMGADWGALAAYALERAQAPNQQTALGELMPRYGMSAIPAEDLARIDVPTTLIWGRHDLATSLRVAETASATFGWPLHVIEHAGDDPVLEQPGAFLEALVPALDAPDHKEGTHAR